MLAHVRTSHTPHTRPLTPPPPFPPPADALDPALQDDLIATRCLLMTRCEANNLIFNQLVRHVGLEGTGGQGSGAVVFNTSMLTTNSLNQCRWGHGLGPGWRAAGCLGSAA